MRKMTGLALNQQFEIWNYVNAPYIFMLGCLLVSRDLHLLFIQLIHF